MKSGEKTALRFILLTMVAVIGLTVYLEIGYQEKSTAKQTNSSAKALDKNVLVAISGKDVLVIPKGMNPDDLPDAGSRGATMLTLYCTQCHDLPTPAMHSAAEWQEVLTRMDSYLQSNQRGLLSRAMMPSKKDWGTLSVYFKENAQIPLNPDHYADIKSPAGQAYLATCSQCHETPSPDSHTEKEWPRVVLRMEANMVSAKREKPNAETRTLIISFLQTHSKKR